MPDTPSSPASSSDTPAPPRRIQAIGADAVTLPLLQAWLADEGWEVSDAELAPGEAQLIVVDMPFPRRDGAAAVHALTQRHPGSRVLVVSPTFLSSVVCTGECARQLGVDAVLPKPLMRSALLDAVRRIAPGA
jgi:DNA-binding NarL/FixJ family response regulator